MNTRAEILKCLLLIAGAAGRRRLLGGEGVARGIFQVFLTLLRVLGTLPRDGLTIISKLQFIPSKIELPGRLRGLPGNELPEEKCLSYHSSQNL